MPHRYTGMPRHPVEAAHVEPAVAAAVAAPAVRRFAFGLLLLALLMTLSPLRAAAAGPAERAQAVSPQEETLSVGDKVTVSVFGQADLSGDFVLDGTGSLQMPLIGRIAIAGMTPQQAEIRIRDGLTDGYLREAVVSLRIAELKPVYIMGEVRTPGSYPFRHGLNVLGAVALAGGYRTGDQSLSILKSELLLAEDRLRGLDTTLQMQTARRIRLEAERDGLKQIPTGAMDRSPAAIQLMGGEREIFEFQRRARDGERELLSQQVARLEAERTALAEQGKLAEQQVALTREQSSEYGKLAATGHGLRTVQVEREREYSRTRSDLARIRADIAKNETALGELSLRLKEADTAFTRRVVLELQETRQKIVDVERSIPVAREIYESRRRGLAASEGSGGQTDWDIRILRQSGMQPSTLAAGFDTTLRPGDIVQIAPRLPDQTGAVPLGEARAKLEALAAGPVQR
jgi:polysaccharide export outer membrane protein